jgi:N-acetylglucosamine kinase-like BadF-type ATPase
LALASDGYLVCVEGGGTRSQAALFDPAGTLLLTRESTSVNTNFVTLEASRAAVVQAVGSVLEAAGITGERVTHCVSALVGPRFGPEALGALIPNASYHYYGERDVIFARAGIYQPHGVAVVAATGATAWGVRADDGRQMGAGGWGTLLGDEGSAYAVGVAALRRAAKAFEGRVATPTRLVEALQAHFELDVDTYRSGMYNIAYWNPISRAEIAALAVLVTRLAAEGDLVALQITEEAAADITSLALYPARVLFESQEGFDVAGGGGLFNAGELIVAPLREGFAREFPHARLTIGKEDPAVALGRLALYHRFRPLYDKERAC